MGRAVGISSISCLGAEKHAIKVYWPPSWNFPVTVWSHSLLVSLIGKRDPENIGMAFGISVISGLRAEIHAFEVCRPPSWIFPLPVKLHSIPIYSIGKLDPKSR